MNPTRRFVDLSIYLENDVLSDPPPLAPKITYQKHADTPPAFMTMIPGTQPEDYPNGTHLDLPFLRQEGERNRQQGADLGRPQGRSRHRSLSRHGFTISCFPNKIRSTSAGRTRAVVIFDDSTEPGAHHEL